MEKGAGIPTIKELPARCNCEHPPTALAIAEHETKVAALEGRLQALEDKLRDGSAQVKGGDSTETYDSPTAEVDSIQPIGTIFQTIEQRMQERPVETTTPITLAEGPLRHQPTSDDVGTTRSGNKREQLRVPIPLPLEPVIRWGFNVNRIRGFAHRTQSRSPSSDCDGAECEDSDSETHITPSTGLNERSVTLRPGPEDSSPSEEPELTRAILRQEINKALAAAMVRMGELLGSANNGGA